MYGTLFLVGTVLVPMLIAFAIAGREDRIRLASLIFFSGTIFLAVLSIINIDFPFSGSGDERSYYASSLRTFKSFGDWFDLTQFKSTHSQGGYSLVLSWVHQIVGKSLYLRKALNISLFLFLSLVWFSIGKIIGGRRLAFVFGTGILLGTPMWYYFIILRKDMSIILLQSGFLLGLTHFMSGRNSLTSYFMIGLSTLALIPFRMLLVFVHLAVISSVILFRPKQKRQLWGLMARTMLPAIMVIAMLAFGTNKDLLGKLGVSGNASLDIESVQKSIEAQEKSRTLSLIKFPVLYLIGETSAFTPRFWRNVDAMFIRGVGVIPWVFIGLPFFISGILSLVNNQNINQVATTTVTHVKKEINADLYSQTDRMFFIPFIFFLIIYAAVSWLSGDTTRWRLPAVPVMIAIAGWGWASLRADQRFRLILIWSFSLSILLFGYYSLI